MNFQRSFQMRNTPLRNNRSMQFLQTEDTLNLSPILNETSIYKTLNDTSLRHVLDESTLIGNNGKADEDLDGAFYEVIKSSRPSDILSTLSRLSEACRSCLEQIEPWNRYNAHNYWLAEEANTWKLLEALYSDSITKPAESIDSILTGTVLSQSTLFNALLKSNSEITLLQLLVNWLEAAACYQQEATKTSVPVIGENIHWGNTLHQLLLGSSLFNKEKNAAMVTCLDPDAPKRQKKTVHTDDQQDDNDLCKRVFTEMRCGKFLEAVSLCISAGQDWRGAVLHGARLVHYLPREDLNDHLEVLGNPSRDLWKYCAMGIANNVSENIHYRATLGILCGHLPSTIPACQGNWEDLLWAHLKVQIEARIAKFFCEHHATVSANTTTPEVLELLQSELTIEEMSLQQIFGAVNALMDGKRESNYQTCQRHLMLGHIRTIMQESLQWLESTDERFIRFLAHLVLILRQMGKDPLHDIGDHILEKYVTQLINRLIDGSVECPELIAYYTSTVPVERQIMLYADLMNHTHKSDYRQGVVKAGITSEIDVAASARVAIKKAITDIQQGYGNIDLTFTQTTAVEKDKTLISKVISSLEWLSLIPNQVAEALWLSNAMTRTFIFISNIDAASACVVNFNQTFQSQAHQISSDAAELKEHKCLKAYLEALEGFATWHRHFISGQPKDLEPLHPDASFSDKVHHEQRCEQVEQMRAKWKNVVIQQSKHTKRMLYNILLFHGGWLQDETDCLSECFSNDEKHERSKQLETLRRLCIPEVILLILKILQSTDDIDNHKEAVKLSDIIANESKQLYRVFTKDKLCEVLERIKESSLLLLEKGRDMFGYEITD